MDFLRGLLVSATCGAAGSGWLWAPQLHTRGAVFFPGVVFFGNLRRGHFVAVLLLLLQVGPHLLATLCPHVLWAQQHQLCQWGFGQT